jgi:hypothetical protein
VALFIHSIAANNQSISADGVQTIDLPVNPLSAVLIHLNPLNDTATIGNFGLIQRLLSALDNCEILHKGTAIVSASGADLVAFSHWVNGVAIAQSNPVDTDNDRRSLVIPVLLGRKAYDPSECFPRSRRGELQLQLTWDIADTGFDGLRISVETVELPEATPTHVQKLTTLTQTFAATGDNDVDLPIGHLIRGVLCFGTTGFAGAAPAPTLGRLSVLRDNIQVGYSSTDFEVSRVIAQLAARNQPFWNEHLHGFVDGAAGQTDTQRQNDIFPMMENYTFIDFDPTRDDLYSLVTEGAGRVHMRINAETANLARFLPIEKFPVDELDLT